jgi:hypothetical protein
VSKGSTVYPFNAADEQSFSLNVTQELLERIESQPLSFEVLGHIAHLTVSSAAAAEAQRQRSATISAMPRQGVVKHHLAAAERWAPFLSNYRAWIEVMELNDDAGSYEPVHVFFKPAVHAGAMLRLRQGSPRRIRMRLSHTSGARLNVSNVKRVTVSDLATHRAADGVDADSYREADLEHVKERFQHCMRESKMERDDAVRALLEKERQEGSLSPDDRTLKQRLMREGEQMLYERDALYGSLVDSGLPGVAVEDLPDEGFEQRLHVLYVPVGSRAVEELPPLTQGHWEATDHDVDLRILSQDLSHDEGTAEVVCAWDAAAHVDQSLSAVTPDGSLVFCRVRLSLEIDLAESPLVITKLLCCKVVKRSANFVPSRWDRMSGTASKSPGGTGINVQVITGLPAADGGQHQDNSQTASLDFDRRMRDVRKLADIDRLEQTRTLTRETHATPARRATMSMGAGGGPSGGVARNSSSSTPTASPGRALSPVAVGGASHLPALEQEINIIQRRLDRARADNDVVLVDVLHARLQDRFNQLAGPR